MLSAELLRDRSDLFGFKLASDASSEPVHSGNMLVLVKFHYAGATPHLHKDFRFLDAVSREHTAVFGAPVVNLLDETVDKEAVHCVPVFISESVSSVALYEKLSEFFPKVDIVFFFEIIDKNGRIRGLPSVILRFVGEKSEHIFAEIFTALFFISLVSKFDEFSHYVFIENIDDRRICFEIYVDVLPLARRLFHSF